MSLKSLTTIYVDNQSKIAKMLKLDDNLTAIRKSLGDKIPRYSSFLFNDSEIDIIDESEILLKDIQDDKKIFIKTVKNPNEGLINIYINDELQETCSLDKKEILSELRNEKNDLIDNDTFFILSDGAEIDLNDEKEVKINDILKNNNLYLKSKTKPFVAPSIIEIKLDIEFYLVDQLKFCKKLLNMENLSQVRKIISSKIEVEFVFLFETVIIDKNEEESIKLYEILDEQKVYLLSTENNDKIQIDIYINDELNFSKKLNINKELSKIRKQLNKKIQEEFQFILKNKLKLDIEDESDYYLKELLIDKNKLFINSNTQNKKEVETNENRNVPIERSTFIYQEGNLNIYLYPEYKFSEEETKKSIKLLVVGPTGSGKTTLLNSYVNYLMGIQYIDDFRYKIIHEETNKNQTHSQTSTVTKYNIRAKDGKLFQIIDTPGFGDTKRN